MEYYVYRFLDGESRVLYVGRTKDIKQRIYSHFASGGHLPKSCYTETQKIEYIRCLCEFDMVFSEIYYINKFQPPYNVRDVYEKDGSHFLNLYEPPFKWTEYRRLGKPNSGFPIRFRLKKIMEERNITHALLMEMTGLNRNTLYALVNDNVKRIDLETLDKLCYAFDCSVEDILEHVKE